MPLSPALVPMSSGKNLHDPDSSAACSLSPTRLASGQAEGATLDPVTSFPQAPIRLQGHVRALKTLGVLTNLCLLVASTLLALAGVELILRIGDGLPLLPSDNLILARADRFTRRTDTIHHPQLGWLPRSNLHAIRSRTEPSLTTGELGVRMNQPDIRSLPGGATLAVGDSFTFGAEVDDASTWPAQLERRLGEPVINGGVGGFGTDQIVLRAESLMTTLSPRTIIVSFLSSDILRTQLSVYNGAAKPYFLLRDGELLAMNQPVPLPAERRALKLEFPRNLLGHSYLVTWVMARMGHGRWFEVEKNTRAANDPVAVTCRLLTRLKREADARAVRLIFIMQWPGEHIAGPRERPSFADGVLACAVELGLQTIDAWDTLKAVHARGPQAFGEIYHTRANGAIYLHMSPAGNTVIAELMARAVSDPGFVILPPLRRREPAPQLDLAVLGEGAPVQNLTVTRLGSSPTGATALLLEDRSPPHGSIYQDVAVADDDLTHTFAVDIKAGSSANAQLLLSYLGGQQRSYYAAIDMATMTVSGDGVMSAEPGADGWWHVRIAGPNNKTGNRTVRVQVFPSQDESGRGTLLIANPRLDP